MSERKILNIFKLKNLIKIIFNPHLIIIRLLYNLKRFSSDIMAKFGRYKHKYNIIFIAGQPMSATTLVLNMLGLIPGYYTRYAPVPNDIAIKQDISESAFKYCPENGFTIFKTHLNPYEENINIIKKNRVKKVIVTYRDLRDVVISEYHRRIAWPMEINEPNYFDYNSISKEEGLNHMISLSLKKNPNGISHVEWIKGWFEISKKYKNFVHFCKFEMLMNSPEHELSKILNFYEIAVSRKKIEKIVKKTKGKKTMIKNMYQSALLPGAMASNFRSGIIGSWKTEFTENNKKHFKNLIGNFLIDLGYAKDNNW